MPLHHASMRTFIIHYAIYSFSIVLILTSLFTLYDHPLIQGFIIGILCLMVCRCNYTGLVCRMFDEDDPMMNPPDAPLTVIELTDVDHVDEVIQNRV